MGNTVVRSYDSLSAAQNAREELLREGFGGDEITLRVASDEAGPVEGNFVEDQKDTGTGPGAGMFSSERRTDAYNDDDPVWGADIVLAVDAADAQRQERAAGIMDRWRGAPGKARPH